MEPRLYIPGEFVWSAADKLGNWLPVRLKQPLHPRVDPPFAPNVEVPFMLPVLAPHEVLGIRCEYHSMHA